MLSLQDSRPMPLTGPEKKPADSSKLSNIAPCSADRTIRRGVRRKEDWRRLLLMKTTLQALGIRPVRKSATAGEL